MRFSCHYSRFRPRFASVAAFAAVAVIALSVSPAVYSQGIDSSGQTWAHYIPKSDHDRSKVIEATTVSAPKARFVPFDAASPTPANPQSVRPPNTPGSSQPPFYAIWVTDKALAALISDRIDREKLSATAAETAYQETRAELHRDDRYVFYCHGPTLYLEPEHINAMTLRRKGDSSTEIRCSGVDVHASTLLSGLDWATRFFVVSFPKNLPDGSPVIRDANETLELMLPTGGSGKLVLEFSLRRFLGEKKALASIADL